MSRVTYDQAGGVARRSVWLLAASGSLIGAVLFVVVALTFLDLRDQRNRNEQTHQASDRAVIILEEATALARDRAFGILNALESADSPNPPLPRAADLIARACEQLIAADLADYTESLDALTAEILALDKETQSWRGEHDIVYGRLANTQQSVHESLQSVRSRIAELDGSQRLDLAVQARRSRQAEESGPSISIKQLVRQLCESSELSSAMTDLATLETAIERLKSEVDADNVANTRDNLLKPLLGRLSRFCNIHGVDKDWQAVVRGILGEESADGPDADPVVQVCLIRDTERRIQLEIRRGILRRKTADAYDSWRRSVSSLQHRTEDTIVASTERIEAKLAWTWNVALVIGLSANVLFFLLAHRIAHTIGDKIQTLDRVSRDLAQAQKMESVGQLAAGIAHEINNPMQYLLSNIEFLTASSKRLFDEFDALESPSNDNVADLSGADREWPSSSEERKKRWGLLRKHVPEAIESCNEGANRIVEIIRAMKSFSHPGDKTFAPTDVNGAILSTVTIARNRWKYSAELETELDENLPLIDARQAELNQVFLNLVVNAADAIDEKISDGELGRITIRSACEGDQVVVTVSDTGAGIPPELVDRLFDPFFTTKEIGKGTGQGLAICYNVIVSTHHGSISIESEPGQGSTFRVKLPVCQAGHALEVEVDCGDEATAAS